VNSNASSIPLLLAAAVLIAGAASLFFAGRDGATSASSRRGADQVILISLDTLRQDHLSLYGYPRPTTPNLERLAADAAVFDHAMAQAPFTLPSHMSMLTGLYPSAHQVRMFQDVLADSFVTLAESLREAGLETAAITDGGYVNARFGFDQGFDLYDDGRVLGTQERNGFRRFGRRVRRFLIDHRDEPFFLFVHSFDTHGPYFVEPEYREALSGTEPVVPAGAASIDDPLQYMRSLAVHEYYQLDRYDTLAEMIDDYDAAIRYVDERVGEIIGLLHALDRFDSSLIIVTSDHGEAFLDHGLYTGHGLTLYEEEVRVPLLVKFPHGRFKGVRSSDVVRLIDLFPTVTASTGVRCPKEVQGTDLARALSGRDPEPRTAFGENPNLSRTQEGEVADPTCYVRRGEFKYLDAPSIDMRGHLSRLFVGTGGYDLDRDPLGLKERMRTGAELYNLARDPVESRNLIRGRRAVIDAIRAVLFRRLAVDRLLFDSKNIAESDGSLPLSDAEIEMLQQQGYLGVERGARRAR